MRTLILAGLVAVAPAVWAAEAPPPIEPPKEVGKVVPQLPPPEVNDPTTGQAFPPAPPKPGDCRIGNTEIEGRRTMVLMCMEADGRWHMRGEVR